MNTRNIPMRPRGQQPPAPLRQSPAASSTSEASSNSKQVEETLNKMLETPWEEVYGVSSDGQIYTKPHTLIGTPTRKLTEDDEYWDHNWTSLDAFLALEKGEEEKKAEAHRLLAADPENARWKAAYKLHSDNISKHRKIREVFGPDTPYHPQQLLSKRHMPLHGLCQKEIMYRLACKFSDLRVLHNLGALKMDPWDFLRWRISKKAASMLTSPWESANEYIRTIIYKIGEDGSTKESRAYNDANLRMAILRSAELSGSINSYRAGKGTKASGAISKPSLSRVLGKSARSNPLGPRPSRVESSDTKPKEKRARQTMISEYQGVNAYRAKQKLRDSEAQGKKP